VLSCLLLPRLPSRIAPSSPTAITRGRLKKSSGSGTTAGVPGPVVPQAKRPT
jgi:hypothetical protein